MKVRTGFVSNSSSSSFAILGFKVTPEIIEIAKKHTKANDLTEDWWGCTKCDRVVGMYAKKIKFCENCGTEMSVISKPKEVSNWELFENLVMCYYDGTEFGKIAGISINNMSAQDVITANNKLVDIFGDMNFSIMVGEST